MIKHGEILNEKVKIKDLQGPQLDWAVSMCENYRPTKDYPAPSYSTDWTHSGPIIDAMGEHNLLNTFSLGLGSTGCTYVKAGKKIQYDGATMLEAALRCYVASKLGPEIEVPKSPIRINKPRRFP